MVPEYSLEYYVVCSFGS